ncbi:hypothetical protein FIZ70_03420 [Escherichia coli]|nr:hypothetical protein [Escherichia coli]
MKSLIIVNPADCIGCRTCEVACVVAHPSEQELNADVFLPRLKVQRLDSISAPVMCHQCENAPCVGACPVGALQLLTERELRRVRQQRIVASGENPL